MLNIVPTVIIIAGKKYYNADDLNKYDPAYFIGTNKYSRGILKKKNISQSEYIYAYEKEGIWKISNESYSRAKLLLSESWTCSNVPKMIIKQKKSSEDTKTRMTVSKNITKNEPKDETKDDLIEYYDIPPAPEILVLSNEEKFKNKDGNIIDIEVRGERNHKKCYFKVKDIMVGFDMPSLDSTILRTDRVDSYIIDEHYKYFTVQKHASGKK